MWYCMYGLLYVLDIIKFLMAEKNENENVYSTHPGKLAYRSCDR